MENTLLAGDFIIVNKIAYKVSTPAKIPFTDIKIPHFTLFETWEPEINELVVFNYPEIFLQDSAITTNQFIKRIVAGPGDTLQFKNKKIFVNNAELTLPPTIKYSNEELKILHETAQKECEVRLSFNDVIVASLWKKYVKKWRKNPLTNPPCYRL